MKPSTCDKSSHSNIIDDSWWDYYSDQPYILKAQDKPRLSKSSFINSLKSIATIGAYSPLVAYKYSRLKDRPSDVKMRDFVGIGVQPKEEFNDQIAELVDELSIKHLLLRVPSWRADQFYALREFMDLFPQQEFIINILQSRQMVMNKRLWQQRLEDIFDIFQDRTASFQIANATNRSKWGCHNMAEYLELQAIAESVRNTQFSHIKLLGASIIDFEPVSSMRSLINSYDICLDGCALALYVNRRLSPFNKQFKIFDLQKKIYLAYAIWQASNIRCKNADNKIWITETNWPLLNTKPYTPNSGNKRSTVDEDTQAQFLQQYIDIAHKTGLVERVYWWQLINPGYGLIDHRSGSLRKMPSFFQLKNILNA